MRWHREKCSNDEIVMRHPADSQAWKKFSKEYDWFAKDPRIVKFGLATDDFNPFGNMSNSYSVWPIVFILYNLPPWKCMKEPYFMMSLLVRGHHAPGKDIDVYMQSLIDEINLRAMKKWHANLWCFD